MIEDVLTGMGDWRTAHPKATLVEIAAAVDERLDRVRARMLQEAALVSRAAEVGLAEVGERPRCPPGGEALAGRGKHQRALTVRGNQQVHLRRSYATCPAGGTGIFPPG